MFRVSQVNGAGTAKPKATAVKPFPVPIVTLFLIPGAPACCHAHPRFDRPSSNRSLGCRPRLLAVSGKAPPSKLDEFRLSDLDGRPRCCGASYF